MEYINNKKLQEDIHRYRSTKENSKKTEEFKKAEMELTKSFYLLAEKIFLTYRSQFLYNVDHDEALQEGTMICFEKIHRFDPAIGKAFPFFTQIIINHYKQLCRTIINYRNLKNKYQNHLLNNSDDPHIQSLRSKGKLGQLDSLEDHRNS